MKAISAIHSFNLGILLSLFSSFGTLAQIVPDQSLPENSMVTTEENRVEIDGGTTRGTNLFHSFEQFSIPVDTTASFNNTVEIQNIFSRITGDSISNIEGILATQGTADLFLINPNGIIFGENASLDVGGSFLATTSESVLFEGNALFSTNIDETSPLLTVTAPIGLNLGTNPGDIINLTFDPILGTEGLEVIPGNTLAFLGGSITIEGGILAANEGRIELGAVAANNFVYLTSDDLGWQLGYQAVNEFQDISFSQSGYISSFGAIGGDIQLQGRNISFIEGGQVFSSTFGSEAGNIVVKASEAITINGTDGEFNSGIFNFVEETATGEGKKVTIETKKLSILDGGQINTQTFGDGQSVDLQINSLESVTIKNTGLIDEERQPSGFFSIVNQDATEDGGTIEIETPQLLIEGGGQITVSTLGAGKAGNLNLIVSDSIKLIGQDLETKIPSGSFARVRPGATGDGGNITIQTPELQVLDGAKISTAGRSTGNGGNLTLNVSDTILLSGVGELGREIDSSGLFVSAEPSFIDNDGNLVITTANAGSLNLRANQLIVEKGAKISADTFGRGEGANVSLDVSNLIIRDGGIVGAGSLLQPVGFRGEDTSDNIRGGGGTLTVNADESITVTGKGNIGNTSVNSTLFTRAEGTGNAGSLTISTPKLTIADGANIAVNSQGSGEAGNINLKASELILDDGSLTAETISTQGGNIIVSNNDILQFNGSGNITASAGGEDSFGNGGNIFINSNSISAFSSSENFNQIQATAVRGNGGNIVIIPNQERDNINVNASSDFGKDGRINSLDVPEFQLPDASFDAENFFAQNLCDIRDGENNKVSSFILTGRGGLPPNPYEPLDSSDILVDVQLPTKWRGNSVDNSSVPSPPTTKPIVEAGAWVVNEKGNVELVSDASVTTSICGD